MTSSTTDLLTKFESKSYFPTAAGILKGYQPAMNLLNETVTLANQESIDLKFGGFAKGTYPYTDVNTGAVATGIKDTIYIPQTTTYINDPTRVMTYFLFELQNARRARVYHNIYVLSLAGRIIEAEYAYKMIEQEVEGGLRVGQMWDEIVASTKKATSGKPKYFHDLYLSVAKNIQTKDQVVKETLKSYFESGPIMTRDQYYRDSYKKFTQPNTPNTTASNIVEIGIA
jgi:hypothetical protein